MVNEIVLFSQIRRSIACKLICCAHAGCEQSEVASPRLLYNPFHTEKADSASKPCKYAKSPDVFLRDCVLDSSQENTGGTRQRSGTR